MVKFALFVLTAVTVLTVNGQKPIWYNGPCGQSKYSDAGDMDLPGHMFKIVGGVEARAFEFPWQVSVRNESAGSHYCGGMIINDRWILTAAHCMEKLRQDNVSVDIGDHTMNDSSNAVRQRLDVERVIMHPNFDSITAANDISLIKVVQTISFDSDIQPVCPPDQSNDYHYRKSVCSGWGKTGGSFPQTLHFVTMNVTTNAFCLDTYGGNKITADMICASDHNGGWERDACSGDSGGPLVVKEADGTFTAIGIVSWGKGCANGFMGVYSRVGYFQDWILNNMNRRKEEL